MPLIQVKGYCLSYISNRCYNSENILILADKTFINQPSKLTLHILAMLAKTLSTYNEYLCNNGSSDVSYRLRAYTNLFMWPI